jgi:hypothetical protein
MEQELLIIQEKRKNILILLAGSLLVVFTLYFLLDSITDRLIESVDKVRTEYRPVVNQVATTVDEAGKNLNTLTGSGVKVMNTLTEEIPHLPDKMAVTVDSVKTDLNEAKSGIVQEYAELKKTVNTDYSLLKLELNLLKHDVRRDVEWIKSEVEKWRQLIIFIGSLIGFIVFLTSIQDILENIRWAWTLIAGFFNKDRKKEAAAQETSN